MPRGKPLSEKERRDVAAFILELKGPEAKPPKGYVLQAMERFGLSDKAIRKVWLDMKKSKENGGGYLDDLAPKLSTRGAKRKMFTPEFEERITSVPRSKRRTYRQAQANTGVNKSTIGRFMKKGKAKSRSSYQQPQLNSHHMMLRMRFCLRRLQGGGRRRAHGGGARFLTGWNVFHIDEKWFNQKQKKTRAICLPKESPEVRTTIHKNHIPKIMFLSCTTKPAPDPRKPGEYLPGQIAIHPFCALKPAKKSSHNRPAGTLEMKTVNVTAEVYMKAMIKTILPKIKDHWTKKMGRSKKERLYIQEDNASPHKLAEDPKWVKAVKGWNIKLLPQPAQSPELNKNEQGLPRAEEKESCCPES